MIRLQVDLGSRSYPIYIGRSLLEQPACLQPHVAARRVLVVSNECVLRLHGERLRAGLAGLDVDELAIADGEAHKNLATFAQILDVLVARRHSRSTTVVAFGGGVVGDVAGFAAACYQRGVDLVQVPTTLLAQVDSSVGGKTAVDHPGGKNLIGAFHQPRAVVADTTTLSTLPERELRAGLAEVIKYGVMRDAAFFAWLEAHLPSLLARDDAALTQAIATSCRIKADVVGRDERESDLRAILNLGHTFGHAIETLGGYGSWLHGEAVAAGIVMAADLSVRLGWLPAADGARIRALLAAAGLPVVPPSIARADWLSAMAMDKKAAAGRIRLVLPRAIGAVEVTEAFPADALAATLDCASPCAPQGVPA
jgi:3-dehydroquinate synthase